MTSPTEARNAIDLSINREKKGLYGNYTITKEDEIEVQRYRFSVLFCGIAFFAGLSQWIFIGPTFAWLWLIALAIFLGLALTWIHIYLSQLHQLLKILWLFGVIGLSILIINIGGDRALSTITSDSIWTLAIGPLFASLTGLGFKEFFCFQRLEAIGLTLFLPLALIGHLSGVLNINIVMIMLLSASISLIILGLRKFGMDPADDIGDKSIFDYLKAKKMN